MRAWILVITGCCFACADRPAPPGSSDPLLIDTDDDGVPDDRDLCPAVFDPLQQDEDYDGTTDACEELPDPSCNADGLCWEYPRPFGTRLSSGAALSDELWIAGNEIHHWDGERWRVVPGTFPWEPIHLIALPDALWALDAQAGLTRRIGSGRWEPVTLPDDLKPDRLWAADATRVWVQARGTLVLTDGVTFKTVPPEAWANTDTRSPLGEVVATSPTNVWSLTDRLRRYDGTRWVDVAPRPYPVGGARTLVFDGATPWLTWYRTSGLELLRLDGQHWEPVAWPTTEGGHLIAGPDGVWTIVDDSQPYRWDGAAWQKMGSPLPMQGPFVAVAGGDAGWLMSRDGGAWRWDGGRWIPLVERPPRPRDIASRGDELWVVGDGGFSARRINGRWQRVPTRTSADLLHLDGRGDELAAAAEYNHVLRLVDGAWQLAKRPINPIDDILIGDYGIIVHGEPAQRWLHRSGLWEPIVSIFGSLLRIAGESEPSLVGLTNYRDARVLRRNGARWDTVYTA